MQRKFLICSGVIMALVLLPLDLSGQLVKLCERASTVVMGGEYDVMNNVGGATTPQCLELYLVSTYFKVTIFF